MHFILFPGHKGTLFCVDGAPEFLYTLLTMTMSTKNDIQLQNSLICHTMDIVAPNNDITNSLTEKFSDNESFDDRIQTAIKLCPVKSKYSDKFIRDVAKTSYDRLKVVLNYNYKNVKKLEAPIVLLRPKENPPFIVIEDNYGLDKSTDKLTVHYLEGNHVSIIDNKDCANIINRVLLDRHGQEGKDTQNLVTSMVEAQREVQA